nr:PREDICTED: protein spire homolog 1-like [Phalacrocorax carbo]
MEQLAQGPCPPLHSVFIKGPGSIFIHADGTASFKVYHKSDVGSIQQSEDKLLEYLGVVIYEALDWGIDSQVERELGDRLEKMLCLMLKLDDEAMKPAVTLQDVIKACEEHLSRPSPGPSEAPSHYGMTCRSLFTEYLELQKLVTIIQTSKESLRKMDVEDLVENPFQKKEKHWTAVDLALTGFSEASLWPNIIHELQNGVRLRKATERPQHHAPPKECIRSPCELLFDDIQHKRYTLRKVIIEQEHRTPRADVAAPEPHLKPVLERKLKERVLRESSWHEQLMAEIKRPQKLRSAAAGKNGSGPKEMLMTPDVALKSPSNSFLTLQDASTEFKIVSATAQQLGPGVQDCPSPTKWPSPTIAELIGTRYTMMVLEGQGFFQGGSGGVFPRAKICFSCHKQMFLKWPYSCYLCSSVVCCDCCFKMSMPFRMCVYLPLYLLKLLKLSREEDPATQEQKSSELLHEIEHWECFGIPVILEPRCLAQPLCCYTGTMANWLTVDVCTRCEQYLLNMASSQQLSVPLRRISWP